MYKKNRILNKLLILFKKNILILLLFLNFNLFSIEYFVSPNGSDNNLGTKYFPFKTIQKARDVIRNINKKMNEDILVYLREGEYSINDTLYFNDNDSGTNGYYIIYKAYKNEHPVISGGKKIKRWSLNSKGIYQARVGNLKFRQLYVNGVRAIRARTPNINNSNNLGPYYTPVKFWDLNNKSITINSENISNWQNLNQIEVVIMNAWHHIRFRIGSIIKNKTDATIFLNTPEKNEIAFGHCAEHECPYYFENAYEFLDSEREWYLDTDKGILYYKPEKGKSIFFSKIIVPVTEQLIKIKGTSSSNVSNIKFIGLTFEYANWTGPSNYGLIDYQGNIQTSSGIIFPGAIHLEHCNNIEFEKNIIRHAGCHGIIFLPNTSNNIIIGNAIYDISSCGIVIDPTLNISGSSVNDKIIDNIIYKIGCDYSGACGILASYPSGLIIEHNEIFDCSYTGISVGWGWTNNITALKNNIIKYNHIYNVCQVMADGGGIYTLSNQPGTYILENYIHDIKRSPWITGAPVNGIFLDQESNDIIVEHNVFENIEADNIRKNRCGNILFLDNDTHDQDIKDNAGPQVPYLNYLKIKKIK